MDITSRIEPQLRLRLWVVIAFETLIWAGVAAYFAWALPLLGSPEPHEIAVWIAADRSPREWVPAVVALLLAARIVWAIADSSLFDRLRLPRPSPLPRTRGRILSATIAAAAVTVAARYGLPLLAGRSWVWPIAAGAGVAVAIEIVRGRRWSQLRPSCSR